MRKQLIKVPPTLDNDGESGMRIITMIQRMMTNYIQYQNTKISHQRNDRNN